SDAQYFIETLPKIAAARISSGPQHDTLLARVQSGSSTAASAYKKFRDFVATTFFDDPSRETGIKSRFAGDRYAFGEQEYEWALKNNLRVRTTSARLYEESWPIVLDTQQQMIALAREIGAKHGDRKSTR